MKLDLILRGGLVYTPEGPRFLDVGIESGRIVELAAAGSGSQASRCIEIEGQLLFPGLIDPHVHFGLGDTIGDEKMSEDFAVNSRDCLVGGVTTIATTTMEGREPLRERFDRALSCARTRSWVNYKITSVIGNHSHIADVGYVIDRGGVSFKFFTGYAGEQAVEFGQDPDGITPALFFEAGEEIRRCDPNAYMAIHAEEPYVRGVLAARVRERNPTNGILSAWAESSPEWAESAQVYTFAFVADSLGLRLYVVHVSSGLTVELIQWLHSCGVSVAGETISLFLTTTAEEMDLAGVAAQAKIQPPIRHAADRDRLWRGVRDGTISVVGTDSLTYSSKFKTEGNFWDCRVGVNVQCADLLPLMWQGAVANGVDVGTLIRILSENAARELRLFPKKGAIAIGSDADLVVFDPDKEARLGVERYRGTSDYSLWEGRAVCGIPVMTLLRGEVYVEAGEIVAPHPAGEHLVYKSPRSTRR